MAGVDISRLPAQLMASADCSSVKIRRMLGRLAMIVSFCSRVLRRKWRDAQRVNLCYSRDAINAAGCLRAGDFEEEPAWRTRSCHPCPCAKWVLSLPFEIRYRLTWDTELVGAVLAVFLRVIQGWYRRQARHQGQFIHPALRELIANIPSAEAKARFNDNQPSLL